MYSNRESVIQNVRFDRTLPPLPHPSSPDPPPSVPLARTRTGGKPSPVRTTSVRMKLSLSGGKPNPKKAKRGKPSPEPTGAIRTRLPVNQRRPRTSLIRTFRRLYVTLNPTPNLQASTAGRSATLWTRSATRGGTARLINLTTSSLNSVVGRKTNQPSTWRHPSAHGRRNAPRGPFRPSTKESHPWRLRPIRHTSIR